MDTPKQYVGTARTAAAGSPPDYGAYYDLETYLFGTVTQRFRDWGYLAARDFFCIVIWKANRAKSRVRPTMMTRAKADLETAVYQLTTGLAGLPVGEARLRYLIEAWGLRLPMASAILTVLYPDEFTVYDVRVCDILRDSQLGDFHGLAEMTQFARLWPRYQAFRAAVAAAAPPGLSLRDQDRYLWGRSFAEHWISTSGGPLGRKHPAPRRRASNRLRAPNGVAGRLSRSCRPPGARQPHGVETPPSRRYRAGETLRIPAGRQRRGAVRGVAGSSPAK